ncbi:MAG: hypothetical protein ABIH46_13390 [Chloroflexota bacterium]
MFNGLGLSLAVIPIDEPWRAIIIVAQVALLALALHGTWELTFTLAKKFRQVTNRFSGRARDASAALYKARGIAGGGDGSA